MIEEAKRVDPESVYASGFLRDGKGGRPFGKGETKLNEAYLLLVESVRRQEVGCFSQPWRKAPAEPTTGADVPRRRVTNDEFRAVVAEFEDWDRRWESVDVPKRPPPTLPEGITW